MGIHARKDSKRRRDTVMTDTYVTHLTADLLLSLNYRFSGESGATHPYKGFLL